MSWDLHVMLFELLGDHNIALTATVLKDPSHRVEARRRRGAGAEVDWYFFLTAIGL